MFFKSEQRCRTLRNWVFEERVKNPVKFSLRMGVVVTGSCRYSLRGLMPDFSSGWVAFVKVTILRVSGNDVASASNATPRQSAKNVFRASSTGFMCKWKSPKISLHKALAGFPNDVLARQVDIRRINNRSSPTFVRSALSSVSICKQQRIVQLPRQLLDDLRVDLEDVLNTMISFSSGRYEATDSHYSNGDAQISPVRPVVVRKTFMEAPPLGLVSDHCHRECRLDIFQQKFNLLVGISAGPSATFSLWRLVLWCVKNHGTSW